MRVQKIFFEAKVKKMHPILKVPNHFFCSDVTRKEKNLSEFEIFEEIEGKN